VGPTIPGTATETTTPRRTKTAVLATSVTDLPGDIGDFESCIVTLTGAYVLPGPASGGGDDGSDPEERDDEGDDDDRDGSEEGGDEQDGEGTGDDDGGDDDGSERGGPAETSEGRRYVEFEEPQEADLVDLQGTNTELVDEREFDVGSYGGLHLEVGSVRGKLADGEEAEVDTPGNAGLKFPEAFEVRRDERTTFVADFTPVRRGRTNRYLIRPVATGTAVLYGDEEYDGSEDDVDDAFYDLDDSDSDRQGDGSDDPDYRPGDDGGEGDD
jgi:hypothetical protein